MLEAIVQLPNNLFYNTGITTYIWLLSNNKPEARKGKVQLIDASLLFRKLRKTLAIKTANLYLNISPKLPKTILISLPKRAKPTAKMKQSAWLRRFLTIKISAITKSPSNARIAVLPNLPPKISRLYGLTRLCLSRCNIFIGNMANKFTTPDFSPNRARNYRLVRSAGHSLKQQKQDQAAGRQNLGKSRRTFQTASTLLEHFGEQQFDDFNQFKQAVECRLKAEKSPFCHREKAVFNAVSWYDENSAKVIAKTLKLKPNELDALCQRYQCQADELADFGYYATGKAGEYILYETSSDLRDSESIPLKQNIHDYFKAEVQARISEAWLNMESVKIGYEISFNKYFYRHKPLRSLAEVAQDILALEKQADGLISEILEA